MDEIIIAFDVDGTILNNNGIPPETPTHLRPRCGVNLEVITLIQILSQKIKNSRIIVWSGGGKEYAEKICREYGLDRYVSQCFSKCDYDSTIEGEVDICFDDVHSCKLAQKNLIVKMK
jgi:phosphoserine phosphatase